MNILFRSDSSSTIGTGHIMRDLVLAARDYADEQVIFAVRDLPGHINHRITEAGYPAEILSSGDWDELAMLIERLAVDTIVIDHYGIDASFEQRLKEHFPALRLVVLDDTYESHFCDVLINHNIFADADKYQDLIPDHCELRCGKKYTLLRDEFQIEKAKGRQNKNDKDELRVLIAMGGSDVHNVTLKVLETLQTFSQIHAHVVTTTANPNLSQLKQFAETDTRVTLHINTNQIASLMNQSDLAIVAPSVTLNEIFYLDMPFMAIQTVNNQKYMVEYLEHENFAFVKNFNESAIKNFIHHLISGAS